MLKDKPYSFPLRPQHPKGGKRRLSSKLRSIQVTITLTFTSVAVLVAVVVSLMLYNKFAKTAEENANMNMQQIIEQVNYNLGLYVKGMRNIFETAEEQITNSPSVDSALLTERMAMLMGSREDLVSAAVFTPQGKYVVGTPGQKAAQQHTAGDSELVYDGAKNIRALLFRTSYSEFVQRSIYLGRVYQQINSI